LPGALTEARGDRRNGTRVSRARCGADVPRNATIFEATAGRVDGNFVGSMLKMRPPRVVVGWIV